MRRGTEQDSPGGRPGRRHSRRSVVIAGASGLAVAGLAFGAGAGKVPFSPALHRSLGAASSPSRRMGFSRTERVFSSARGRTIDLVTILPTKSPPPGLPMCVLLHGLHGSARTADPTGLVERLGNDVARGAVPPFGFVAVDGGNSYWHERLPGDDPMAMLLDELPGWLRERGLGDPTGTPFACAGMSMGGFGALLYARRRAERGRPPAAIGTLAPALITSWAEMRKRDAFRDATAWASLDPLRNLAAIRGIHTAVWCGTEDKFISGVRRFIARADPVLAYTARGRHGDTFNRTVVHSMVGFLGKHAPTAHNRR
ncbi:alpha/beta hydrolase [Amycolatopsis cihanbeyliensis]|uniref:alpha/beta hydrolase n=1 Tax=Amycolatopsis cihanbeyliensis TaxID=1128664 RepID=UPI00114DBC81|nr:alpha/beta hydrolase-fold protein [Amycolatopsis cihanbeyliensis]